MNQSIAFNPFNITKAVDYTDAQINQAWVDLPTENGKFTDIVKPTMSMPMIILGGKGSGKTHIMRYFSYALQKIRYGDTLKEALNNDRYIGIYMRCGGLNAKRFLGKGVNSDQWLQIFSYYMELWLSQLVLDALIDILPHLEGENFSEHEFVDLLLELIDKPIFLEQRTLKNFKLFLNIAQKRLDYEINQLSLSRNNISEKIEILVSPGKLIFGIPKIIETKVPFFNNFQILYLIDEYENLEEYHQKYFNTLIRERESPATFRVGVRLYGVRTFETYSANESIKEGSEYELFDIDSFLRSSNRYSKYMEDICYKRLELSGYSIYRKNLKDYFEEFSIENLNHELASINQKHELNHFIKLKSKKKQKKYKDSFIDEVVKNLTFKNDYLLERTNVFLFYRSWKENNTLKYLLKASLDIKKDCSVFYSNSEIEKTRHYTVLEKFRNDLVDQLCRENNIDLPYYGFENFIAMSSGIPRVLLKTLKEIFKQSYFNGEKPFIEGKISKKSQIKGLKISTDWFIDDAPPTGNKLLRTSLINIGDFLREIKFSDLPPECSISIFSINNSYISDSAALVLRLLTNYSYIILVPERREKNGNSINRTYQINGIIAPKWELSINRRGVIPLNRDEVDTIFGEATEKFDEIIERRRKKYNHPLTENSNTLPLFEDELN